MEITQEELSELDYRPQKSFTQLVLERPESAGLKQLASVEEAEGLWPSSEAPEDLSHGGSDDEPC